MNRILSADAKRDFAAISEDLVKLTPRQMAEVFRSLREIGHPQQALLEHMLIHQLVGRDPATMLDLKVAYPDLPILGTTYRTWAQTDPVAALEHVKALENDTWYETGLSSIFRGLGDADPKRGFEALTQMPEATGAHYANLFLSWSTRAPAEAASAIDEVPEAYRPGALRLLADNWPEIDARAARAWMDSLPAEQDALARPTFEARMTQLENRGIVPGIETGR